MNAVLGVGGGIAAYKAAELARALMERGFRVQVVMTRAAQEFVQPLTFAALTGQKVITDLFGGRSPEETLSSSVEHIAVAQDNEVLVVAPATADLLAKFAHGLADDFLSTLYLAFRGTVVLAPAMNTGMWEHPATQANVAALRRRGHVILDPDEGILACGTTGAGRLPDPERIAGQVSALFQHSRDLEGETVLVTAGPTQEPLDPVRFLSNRSSGRMGYALAEAARSRGARAVLVSGPVSLDPPGGVETVRVQTAAEMRDMVLSRLPEATMLIMAAAVSDYRAAQVAERKIKKTGNFVTLTLEPNPDILAELGRLKGGRILIGFAAETENLQEEARRKLAAKNCDMIVANLVGREGTGFDAEENEVVLITAGGEAVSLPRASKRVIADQILAKALSLRRALSAAG